MYTNNSSLINISYGVTLTIGLFFSTVSATTAGTATVSGVDAASVFSSAFIALVWQIKMSELYIIAVAPVGICFTLAALFTGATWGKPMWGAWWVWDARLTSELILLFLYVGILSLYNAFDDKKAAGKATCILTLVGSINLPIIHYSVEWWNTLHQGASITKFDKPSIDPSMLWPLLINLLGFGFLLGYLGCVRMKNEILQREKHRPWVKQVITAEVNNAV